MVSTQVDDKKNGERKNTKSQESVDVLHEVENVVEEGTQKLRKSVTKKKLVESRSRKQGQMGGEMHNSQKRRLGIDDDERCSIPEEAEISEDAYEIFCGYVMCRNERRKSKQILFDLSDEEGRKDVVKECRGNEVKMVE